MRIIGRCGKQELFENLRSFAALHNFEYHLKTFPHYKTVEARLIVMTKLLLQAVQFCRQQNIRRTTSFLENNFKGSPSFVAHSGVVSNSIRIAGRLYPVMLPQFQQVSQGCFKDGDTTHISLLLTFAHHVTVEIIFNDCFFFTN